MKIIGTVSRGCLCFHLLLVIRRSLVAGPKLNLNAGNWAIGTFPENFPMNIRIWPVTGNYRKGKE